MFQGFLKRQGVQSSVRQGFCIVDDKAYRHYWVETSDGEKLDIIKSLAPPEMALLSTELVEHLPDDEERADKGNKLVSENESQYELFTSNPKQFWKDAPMSIKKFKH
jgi:hypothetical protein